MRKLIFGIIGLVFAVLTIGIGAALSSSSFDLYLKQRLISALTPTMRASIGEFSRSGLQFSMREVELFVPRAFLSARIDQAKVDFGLFSLLRLAPTSSAELQAYGGKLSLAASISSLDQVQIGSFELQHLDLAQHPQLLALGITSGVLSGDGSDLVIEQSPKAGKLNLELKNLSIDPEGWLIRLSGIPSQALPRIESASAVLRSNFANGSWIIEQLVADAGFGSFSGRGQVGFDTRGQPQSVSLSGNVKLSGEGVVKLGPFMPLISNGVVPAEATTFPLRVDGSIRAPRVSFN